MPNNKRHTKKQMQGSMESVHPSSRRAGQLDRIVLRKSKLGKATQYRAKAKILKLERPLFFHHAIPPPPFKSLPLPQLHELISKVYLERHDEELVLLQKERRPGRPKARREIELEEIKRKEASEYDAGFECPDLTHEPTVTMLRNWTSADPAFLPLLRYIRVSRLHPDTVTISHKGLGKGVEEEEEEEEETPRANEGDDVEDGEMQVEESV